VVIGEKFAWGHLRKTGGNATLELFQLFPELILMADPNQREDKHRPFAQREAQLGNKLLVCNIRRLPSLVLSWCHHKNFWGHKGHHVPMTSPHQMAECTFPDEWLAEMTDHGRFEIGWWLRWEDLAADFIAFVSKYTDVSDEKKERAFELGAINALHYDHEVAHWFSDEQISRLYETNPIWAAAEQQAYENRQFPDQPRLVSPVDAAVS
jgi:hypothetical protein